MRAATRRRALARTIGCSIVAIAAASATPAWADCAPETVGLNGTIICTDVDPDGLVVDNVATVRVEPGARVLAGARAAIDAPSGYVTVIDNGDIAGGGLPGILIGQAADVVVGAGSQVTGTAAIRLQSQSSSGTFANVSNSGQLSGTAGAALVAEAGTRFNIVDNNAGATIGGIAGSLGGLRNYGVVDGGARSAISATEPNFLDYFLFNAGTIRSTGTAPTMDLAARSIGNEGVIENGGSGSAIASNGSLAVENRMGARIATAGDTAILAAGAISLVNRATIVGSVVSTAAAGDASMIDTSAGTIQGDVRLGAGNDMLLAGFDFATGRITAVSGSVDGGGGIDTLAARIARDTTIDAIALPTNFERLRIDLADNASVSLAPGVRAPFGLALGGNGQLTVQGDLVTNGPAFSPSPPAPFDRLSFVNVGSITANLADPSQRAIDLRAESFDNRGRITANGGDGVRIGSTFFTASTTNSGTIAASGTALRLEGGALVNMGEIISSGGVAVQTSSTSGPASVNVGTIRGATPPSSSKTPGSRMAARSSAATPARCSAIARRSPISPAARSAAEPSRSAGWATSPPRRPSATKVRSTAT